MKNSRKNSNWPAFDSVQTPDVGVVLTPGVPVRQARGDHRLVQSEDQREPRRGQPAMPHRRHPALAVPAVPGDVPPQRSGRRPVQILVDDLAYDRPHNDVLRHTSNDFLTPYDGVQAVRLTALGAHLLGRTATYAAPDVEAPPEAEVRLDDAYLLFTLSADDRIKQRN